MRIESEVSKAARFGEDAIEGFNTAVNNGQARLAMSILVDIINAFDEKFDQLDEVLAPKAEVRKEQPQEIKPEPKAKAKEQTSEEA